MEWQPIKTAPKDGFFLICNMRRGLEDYDTSVSVVWRSSKEGFSAYLTDDESIELPYLDGPATHWMPLPEPPK